MDFKIHTGSVVGKCSSFLIFSASWTIAALENGCTRRGEGDLR